MGNGLFPETNKTWDVQSLKLLFNISNTRS